MPTAAARAATIPMPIPTAEPVVRPLCGSPVAVVVAVLSDEDTGDSLSEGAGVVPVWVGATGLRLGAVSQHGLQILFTHIYAQLVDLPYIHAVYSLTQSLSQSSFDAQPAPKQWPVQVQAAKVVDGLATCLMTGFALVVVDMWIRTMPAWSKDA